MDNVDYDKVIADLETKRAQFNAHIDAAIQGIKHVLSAVNALSGTPLSTSTTGVPSEPAGAHELRPDAFFGLNIAEASMKFLGLKKRQQTTREIVDGLEGANYHHTSKNFTNTVNTALYRRERDEGDVVKIGRKWALAEWYPGRKRRKGNGDSGDSDQSSAKPQTTDSESTDNGNDVVAEFPGLTGSPGPVLDPSTHSDDGDDDGGDT